MERVIVILVIAMLAFIAIQMTSKVEKISKGQDEYFGAVEKPECESCALTSLEPKRVCPSGMCSMKGRTGCRV
jgi:hypothetical protein